MKKYNQINDQIFVVLKPRLQSSLASTDKISSGVRTKIEVNTWYKLWSTLEGQTLEAVAGLIRMSDYEET